MRNRHSFAALNVLLLVILAIAASHCGKPTPTAAVPFTPVASPTRTQSPEIEATSPAIQQPTVSATSAPSPSATNTPPAAPTAARTATVAPTTPATPTSLPGATNTPEPQPTWTSSAAEQPFIHYFKADVDVADPGDTIILSWESSDATGAVLSPITESGQMPPTGVEVAASGTITYLIPIDARNVSQFYLSVYDDAGGSAGANLTVPLRCPVAWFFQPEPEVCGSDPIHSDAAEQHFQHGTMIWVAEKDAIFVLYDDDQSSPKWEMLTDEWDEGEPNHDPTILPPAGLFQPIRGFGLIWREHDWVRGRLGWAVDQERAFETTMQSTTLYKYNSIYLRALDGRVWHLGPERGSWAKLTVTEP